jgi:hexokinase
MAKLTPQKYLDQYNFYSYKKAVYLEKLSQAVKESINNDDHQITLPIPPKPGSAANCYAIELGGTYLKLVNFSYNQKRIKILSQSKIAFFQNILYTPESFFTELKNQLDKFIQPDQRKKLSFLSFSFGFAIKQFLRKNGLLDGKILDLGKNLQHQDLLGLPLGRTFEKFLQQHGYKKIKVSVVNDSTSSVISSYFYSNKKYPIHLNLIVGTGLNLTLAEIKNQQLLIKNLEIGHLNFYPYTIFDLLVDKTSINQGHAKTEKMISGNWQNQLFKVILVDLHRKKLINKEVLMSYGFKSSAELEKVLPRSGQKFINQIWQEINKRAATITSQIIAETIKQTNSKNSLLLETGGVIAGSRVFRKTLHKNLRRLAAPHNFKKLFIDQTTAGGAVIMEEFNRH